MNDDPIITQWPEISFKIFDDVEIENPVVNALYRTIWGLIRLPQTTVEAFQKILTEPVD